MQSKDLNKESAFSRMSRVISRADFVRNLGSEIGQAARRRMGRTTGMPFAETVIELRKLVRLLHQTLVPVQPQLAFKQALEKRLQVEAINVEVSRQKRRRWLVIGSVVGSLLSLLGVLTALLLRRRYTRLRTDQKTVGAV